MRLHKLVLVVVVALFVSALALPSDARRPALYGPDAGFWHARFDRVPITVRAEWLRPGVRYWNSLAGWSLFVFTEEAPEVTAKVYQNCRYCAMVYPGPWDAPYESCNVSVAADGRDASALIAHEMGHCLGLRHQDYGVMDPTGPDDLRAAWRAFDRGLLLEAGYADS